MYIPFVAIENDNQAEDLVCKIKESEAEKTRLQKICFDRMDYYRQKIEEYEQAHEANIADAIALLGEYCRKQANHNTKTLDSYKLPSGKLQWTRKQPKVIRDDKALLQWMKNNNIQLVKIEAHPDWETLKRACDVIGDNYVTKDGIIVEGVYLEEQPEVFEVK